MMIILYRMVNKPIWKGQKQACHWHMFLLCLRMFHNFHNKEQPKFSSVSCMWPWKRPVFSIIIIYQYLIAHPLFLTTCLHRVGIEWTSFMRWSWVTTRCRAAMSDSVSSHLVVGCLFDISKATFCQRFSIGFKSGDWAGQSRVLMLFWSFHLVTSFARWHGALWSWKKNWSWNSCWADDNMRFCSIVTYLVALTIPSTMCRRPMPLADMQPQTMIFKGCFTVRFRHSGLNSSPGNLLTYVWAWLTNKQKVLSSLNNIFSHISHVQLEYFRAHWILLRLWASVITGFLRALQPLRPNFRHRLRTVDAVSYTHLTLPTIYSV